MLTRYVHTYISLSLNKWHASLLPLPYYVRRFHTDHDIFTHALSLDVHLDLDLALFVAPPRTPHPPPAPSRFL
jgi:hypothetical protein